MACGRIRPGLLRVYRGRDGLNRAQRLLFSRAVGAGNRVRQVNNIAYRAAFAECATGQSEGCSGGVDERASTTARLSLSLRSLARMPPPASDRYEPALRGWVARS